MRAIQKEESNNPVQAAKQKTTENNKRIIINQATANRKWANL